MQTRVDLVNYVLYQAGWLALVLLAAAHRPLMATVVGPVSYTHLTLPTKA